MPKPQDFFNREMLRELAGDKAFPKGEDYFRDNRVRGLKVEGANVQARVSGARPYLTRILGQAGGGFEYSCDCPVGRDGGFCKHLVATALAWLAGHERGGRPDPLRDHVEKLSRERLVDLLLEAMDYDGILRRRLALETLLPTPDAVPEPEELRKLIREAIITKDYIDYDALPDYAQGIEEVLQPIPRLIKESTAGADLARHLCEYSLMQMEKVAELADFGDPALTDLWQKLHEWHLAACRKSRPDPRALARLLLDSEIASPLGNFRDALTTYGPILGEAGVRAYGERLEAEWNRLPTLRPGDATPRPAELRVQVTALMERLVERSGDLDLLVRVRSRDLSTPHDFLSLCELLHRRGRLADAIKFASEGWAIFAGERPHADELRLLLAGYLLEAGRADDALQLIWQRFREHGTLEAWQALRRHVEKAGRAAGVPWADWNARAITFLREKFAAEAEGTARHAALGRTLVELFLADDRPADAWELAPSLGPLPDHLWIRLAEARERSHPRDAIEIYQGAATRCIAAGTSSAYRKATEYISRVRRLLEQQGRAGAFEQYRAELRRSHRNKRSFLRLLDTLE